VLLPTLFFIFMLTPTTYIYTLSLHDALPIFLSLFLQRLNHIHLKNPYNIILILFSLTILLQGFQPYLLLFQYLFVGLFPAEIYRSEEHTSELQSRENLVCRLLLEKKNNNDNI